MSSPRKKGIRSILKGIVIIGSFLTGFGMLGAYAVAAYNGLQSIFNAGKRNATKFLGYGGGALLSIFSPWYYAIGLEVTGGYRVAANKKLLYDNPRTDYVSSLYGPKTGMI